MKKKWRIGQSEGQSLVEMTLTLPILLLMFAGLFEVGAALRNHLIVVNSNREGARFAARGRWFEDIHNPTAEDAEIIFGRVVAAAGTEGQDRHPFLRPQPIDDLDLAANTAIAVHYIEVPDQVDETGGPVNEGYVRHGPWISGTLPAGASPIDSAEIAEMIRQSNQEFNQRYKDQMLPSSNNFIIVELWYEHEQMLGLPFFTSILPETFPLYAQTTMRVTLSARQSGGTP